ncbi:MAG: hypothetical protein M3198_12430 [Actinomycetota bacterium]|nr:hypothetical protein [Actinomycetota bacterium]
MRERVIATTIFLTVVAVTVGTIFPGRRQTALLLWVMAMLGYALLELNSRSRALVRERSGFDRLLEESINEPIAPEDLRRLERGLGWMTYEPSYFDFRVRPILRELIVHRARERRGIDLEDDPSAAVGRIDRELLDLASSRKAEEIYGTENIKTGDIARMVTRIEAL